MRKVMMILSLTFLIGILGTNCAHSPTDLDPVPKPALRDDQIRRVCYDPGSGSYSLVSPDSYCPVLGGYWGIGIEADGFRKLDKYWGALELRNE